MCSLWKGVAASAALIMLVAVIWSIQGIIMAAPVDLAWAHADVNDAIGEVTITLQGDTGTETDPSYPINGTDGPATGGTGITELTVNPAYTAEPCFCQIEPDGKDAHAIEATARDGSTGPAYMRVALEVRFEATGEQEYVIKWENERTHVTWKGLLDANRPTATAYAKFQAWTRKPFDNLNIPGPRVGIMVDADGYWEKTKTNGVLPINMLTPNQVAIGQSETFSVTAATTGPLTHTSYTTVEVELTKSTNDTNGNGTKIRSETTEWKIYDWDLKVSVAAP